MSFPQEATTALSGGCTRLYDFETGSVDGWTWQPLDNSSYSQTGISLTSQYYQSGSHGLMLSWNSVNYAWATYYTNTSKTKKNIEVLIFLSNLTKFKLLISNLILS